MAIRLTILLCFATIVAATLVFGFVLAPPRWTDLPGFTPSIFGLATAEFALFVAAVGATFSNAKAPARPIGYAPIATSVLWLIAAVVVVAASSELSVAGVWGLHLVALAMQLCVAFVSSWWGGVANELGEQRETQSAWWSSTVRSFEGLKRAVRSHTDGSVRELHDDVRRTLGTLRHSADRLGTTTTTTIESEITKLIAVLERGLPTAMLGTRDAREHLQKIDLLVEERQQLKKSGS